MKNRILCSIISLLILLSLTACGGDGTSSSGSSSLSSPTKESQESDSSSSSVVIPSADSKEPAQTVTLESSGVLGDYGVEIHEFELSRDASGSPAIIINYTFTNNGSETTNGITALSDAAYQNGVQLDTAIIMTGGIGQDQMKDIQSGASIELQSAFLLSSDTAPVEFEVSEMFSLSDEKIGKVFQISEGGETVLSVAPEGVVSKGLGDYTVSIISYRTSADYEGSPAIIISLGFTNNGKKATNFMTSISCKAFQSGVQLDSAFIMGEDSGTGASQIRNVKPGAGTEVTVAYVLSSETEKVSIEIEELFSFSNEKLETSIDLT